jgi:hypothetical protein
MTIVQWWQCVHFNTLGGNVGTLPTPCTSVHMGSWCSYFPSPCHHLAAYSAVLDWASWVLYDRHIAVVFLFQPNRAHAASNHY